MKLFEKKCIMKNLFKKITYFLVIFITFSFVISCEEKSEAPMLSRPGLLLDENNDPIITETSASVGCRVYTDGGSPITEVGALWEIKTTQEKNEMQFPTVESAAHKVIGEIEEAGVGAAEAYIEGFPMPDTVYIVRMYAINKDGKIGYSYPTGISNAIDTD